LDSESDEEYSGQLKLQSSIKRKVPKIWGKWASQRLCRVHGLSHCVQVLV
jgi:hypothetical protein